jgi:single-stranded-DNA-specific exonuclease
MAAELSLDTARVLRGAGPWGQGFPEPVFDGDFQVVDARIVGGKHLKMQLRVTDRADSEPIEAIAFGYLGGAAEDPQLRSGAKIQVAYRLEVNEYRGVERVQLNCQHFNLAQ